MSTLINCSKGHRYDPSRFESCPQCAKMRGGGPPKTTYNEDPPGAPFGGGGFQPAQRPWGSPVPPPVAPPPRAPAPRGPMQGAGGKTIIEEPEEAFGRLMGFVVVTDTKQDEEWRYIRLGRGVNPIGGFGSRTAVEIRDQEVSLEHALIICTNKAARLVDLGSTNGTFVNGERVEMATLTDGDRIRVGRTSLTYVLFPWIAED